MDGMEFTAKQVTDNSPMDLTKTRISSGRFQYESVPPRKRVLLCREEMDSSVSSAEVDSPSHYSSARTPPLSPLNNNGRRKPRSLEDVVTSLKDINQQNNAVQNSAIDLTKERTSEETIEKELNEPEEMEEDVEQTHRNTFQQLWPPHAIQQWMFGRLLSYQFPGKNLPPFNYYSMLQQQYLYAQLLHRPSSEKPPLARERLSLSSPIPLEREAVHDVAAQCNNEVETTKKRPPRLNGKHIHSGPACSNETRKTLRQFLISRRHRNSNNL